MSRRYTLKALLAGSILLAAGCGIWLALQGSKPARAADVQVVKSIAHAATALADGKTGTIKGKVTLKGTPPVLKPLHKMGDPMVKDSAVCAAADMPNQTLLVNAKEGNGVANVCIYMVKVPDGYKAPPVPKEPIDFDQKGCSFLPHCMPVRVGQTVLVKSGDGIAHNTHTSPVRAKEFNQAIAPNNRTGVPLVYDKTERVPVSVRCDLHPFMKAYHLVQDHPFMAVTDDKGEFEIKDVPAGKHTFIVWQERPGYLDKALMVTVTAGKETKLDLAYEADKYKEK